MVTLKATTACQKRKLDEDVDHQGVQDGVALGNSKRLKIQEVVLNASPGRVAEWRQHQTQSAESVDKLRQAYKEVDPASMDAEKICIRLSAALRSRDGHEHYLQLYDQYHSQPFPPRKNAQEISLRKTSSLSQPLANSGLRRQSNITQSHDRNLAYQPEPESITLTNWPSADWSDSAGLLPKYIFLGEQIWIRAKDTVRMILAKDGQRRAQIERETGAKVLIIPNQQDYNTLRDRYWQCRISGSRKAISQAKNTIQTLLSGATTGRIEADRLDAAAVRNSAKFVQKINHPEDIKQVVSSGFNSFSVSKGNIATGMYSSAQETNISPAVTTNTLVAQAPLPKTPQKLTRFTLGETDDESSSSSSDDTSESSSDEDSESESETTPARHTRVPSTHSEPPLSVSDEFPIRTSERVVIKIEDDSDDDSIKTDFVVSEASATCNVDNVLSTIPKTGNMKVSEVKHMLEQQLSKSAKLQHEVKILQYALHYKGVTDFQIKRMHAQVAEGGRWNGKFADILGAPRKGNDRDGGKMTSADTRRLQSGSAGLRRAS